MVFLSAAGFQNPPGIVRPEAAVELGQVALSEAR